MVKPVRVSSAAGGDRGKTGRQDEQWRDAAFARGWNGRAIELHSSLCKSVWTAGLDPE